MKKNILISVVLILIVQTIVAQNMPHRLLKTERDDMQRYLRDVTNKHNNNSNPNPPVSPVRTMAEWEEVQALFVTWTGHPNIIRQIIDYAQEECKVYVFCTDSVVVKNNLSGSNIPTTNVHFVIQPFNSIWIRDYGPWAAYTNNVDSLSIIDWIYNRPRPLDDKIPEKIADIFSLPIYQTTQAPNNLVHTGGNFMCDGLGTGFSSKLVLNENNTKTEAQIDGIMNKFMGINRYLKMDVLPYDIIHHIDMHLKLLDEETLLVGEYPSNIADGPQIENNIQYIVNNFNTAFGNKYKIVRIPMPPDANNKYPDNDGNYRTFTNAIFLNKTILVPIYELKYDTIALNIYKKNLPGYKVIGIDCNEIISESGALHCITKTIGVSDPLLIAHPRLRDIYFEIPQSVIAKIQHRTGIKEAHLYYRTDTLQEYLQVSMALNDPENDIWTAQIPALPFGKTVYYYLDATANSGRFQVRPLTAPNAGFSYQIIQPTQVPTINFTSSTTQICQGGNIQFFDASLVGVTQWQWTFNGGNPSTSTEQNPSVTFNNEGTFSVTLSATNAVGTFSKTFENYVQVNFANIPTNADFINGIPNTWNIVNPSLDAKQWYLVNDLNCKGNALAFDNFNTDVAGTNDIFSSIIDLTNFNAPKLTFDVAYASYSDTYFDKLQIIAIPCGGLPIIVYEKQGTDLATSPNTTNAFIPNNCNQWRTDAVDLSQFAGQKLTLQFVNNSGYGNFLYLDNITFTDDIGLELKLNVLLEGAYNLTTALMNTTLLNNSLLPIKQPYNRVPWNYNGLENTTQLAANAVDWVLVELRDPLNYANIIQQKAAILLSNGNIVNANTNFNNTLTFTNLNPGNYYVSVKHRNHLGVVSALPIAIPTQNMLYLTASLNSIIGQNQLVMLNNNIFGLAASDANGSGVINVVDFNKYSAQLNQNNIYSDSDFNLDGSVNITDFKLFEKNASRFAIPVIRY